LLKKFRLLQSTLTNKIKNTMFAVFEDLLVPINNKAKPKIVLEWKQSNETKSCDATQEKVAYAIAVCQIMLDSKQDSLIISESIIKYKLSRNLRKLENSEEFSPSDSDKETSSSEESEISEDSKK
ncbi:5976_t:CDS:2, partial [Scutellospora calospora]